MRHDGRSSRIITLGRAAVVMMSDPSYEEVCMNPHVHPEQPFPEWSLQLWRAVIIVSTIVGFAGGAFPFSPVAPTLVTQACFGAFAWGLFAMLMADFLVYVGKTVSGEHSQLTYALHTEVKRDFFSTVLLVPTLLRIYQSAHHDWDWNGIDIGSLALGFLYSAVYFSRSALRHASTINRTRGRIVISVLIVILFAVIYGSMQALTDVTKGHLEPIRSAWLQVTVLFASVAIFMLVRKVDFMLAERRSFLSPFTVALSKPFVRPEDFERWRARLNEAPLPISARSNESPAE